MKTNVRTIEPKRFLKWLTISEKGAAALSKIAGSPKRVSVRPKDDEVSTSIATVLRKQGFAVAKFVADSPKIHSLKITPKGRSMLRAYESVRRADHIVVKTVSR